MKVKVQSKQEFEKFFVEKFGNGVPKTSFHFFAFTLRDSEMSDEARVAEARRLTMRFQEHCARAGVQKTWANAVTWYNEGCKK